MLRRRGKAAKLQNIVCISATTVIIFACSKQLHGPKWSYRGDVTRSVEMSQLTSKRILPSQMRHMKKILFYTGYNGIADFGVGFGSKPFEKCPLREQRNCESTSNVTEVLTSDAIIFNSIDLKEVGKGIPRWRHPLQRWVIVLTEPPWLFNPRNSMNRIKFNWTMSYRRDSDIVLSHGSFKQTAKQAFHHHNLVSQVLAKRKLVASFSNLCRTESQRETYVDVLQSHIPVDIYSRNCSLKNVGDNNCTVEAGSNLADLQSSCSNTLSNYKFFLAFENAICKDYISGDLFHKMTANVVPVVMGGADYKSIAPKGSYIDVRNFKSVEDLVEHLKYLDKNMTAYLEHFKWKESYEVVSHLHSGHMFGKSFCDLCGKLNDKSEATTFYQNINAWWVREAKCVTEEYWSESMIARLSIIYFCLMIIVFRYIVQFRTYIVYKRELYRDFILIAYSDSPTYNTHKLT